MTSFVEKVLSSIRRVACQEGRLDLHTPVIGSLEKAYVADCLDSSWVSSSGKYIDQFEDELKHFTGARHAICCVNATAGLHASLLGLFVQAEEEVLVPAFSFVATANAVMHANATPHFVDISLNTLGIDPDLLERHLNDIVRFENNIPYNRHTNKKIAALIVVHCFGYPASMERLSQVCKKYNISIIEDAAEALGSYYQGKHVGNVGDISVLSFNGNKIMTTGGGGAILTNDDALALHIRHLISTAKQEHPWEYNHDQLGYNYRLPNLNAALGVAQLKRLPSFLKNKAILHDRYQAEFSSFSDIGLFEGTASGSSNHWLNTIILSESRVSYQQEILEKAHEDGIYLRPIWKMLPKQSHLRQCPKMNLSNAENLENRIINLPSSPHLVSDD